MDLLYIYSAFKQNADGSWTCVAPITIHHFGAKPILVICGDPGGVIGMTRAYDVGVELAAKLPFSRIAIALNERMSTSADRFTELVAETRRWCGTSRP
jgi:hypothetical protein